jgi:hypothetical protein
MLHSMKIQNGAQIQDGSQNVFVGIFTFSMVRTWHLCGRAIRVYPKGRFIHVQLLHALG